MNVPIEIDAHASEYASIKPGERWGAYWKHADGWMRLYPPLPGSGAEFEAAWHALASEMYEIGKASGFYDHPPLAPDFNHEQKLLLMVSEIVEGMEGLRGAPWPGIPDDKLIHRPMLEVELADTIIRIMNYATHCGLDVAGAVVEKAAFNMTRRHRHGGKRF